MLEEEIKSWVEVGKKTAKIREKVYNILEEGISYYELYNKILKEFHKHELDLAFPINISKNEIAAHDTSDVNDKITINKEDVVKIDIGGLLKGGFISDTAITIEVNSEKYEKLVKTCKEILNKVEEILKPGIEVREIGKVVEKISLERGFRPIYNLSGHTIDKYILHSSISIPNFDNKSNERLINTVVAIEVFITNGKGFVKDYGESKIFSIVSKRTRNPLAKFAINEIFKERKYLPFDKIYLRNKFRDKFEIYLNILKREGLIREYPPLVEVNNGIVAQFEHTYIITEKEVIRTT